MKLYALILICILNSVVCGQSYYSPYIRFSTPSSNSGNTAQTGAGIDANINLTPKFKVDLDSSIVKETKVYVGDGVSYRAQTEFGVRAVNNFWILAGGAVSRHSNSSYTKFQYYPIISAHFIPNTYIDFYYTKLFLASGNNDKVKGNRLGYRSYIATTRVNTPLFVQCELNSISFKDASGDTKHDKYVVFGIGVAFKK